MALGPIEPEDVSELEACLQQATQPNVRAKLQRLLDDWRAELARGPARTAAPAPSASTPAIPMALPVPLPCAAGSTRPSTTSSFVPIETFGWDQEGGYPSKWVSVYVMSGIDGVGDLPKESVICRFERDSFDLQIRGLNGKDYRLVKTALEHDIKPEESKVRATLPRARASMHAGFPLAPCPRRRLTRHETCQRRRFALLSMQRLHLFAACRAPDLRAVHREEEPRDTQAAQDGGPVRARPLDGTHKEAADCGRGGCKQRPVGGHHGHDERPVRCAPAPLPTVRPPAVGPTPKPQPSICDPAATLHTSTGTRRATTQCEKRSARPCSNRGKSELMGRSGCELYLQWF